MMKRLCLVLVLMAVVLASCVPKVEPGEEPLVEGHIRITIFVSRVVDAEAGVVCWVYQGSRSGAISCMPLSETELDY